MSDIGLVREVIEELLLNLWCKSYSLFPDEPFVKCVIQNERDMNSYIWFSAALFWWSAPKAALCFKSSTFNKLILPLFNDSKPAMQSCVSFQWVILMLFTSAHSLIYCLLAATAYLQLCTSEFYGLCVYSQIQEASLFSPLSVVNGTFIWDGNPAGFDFVSYLTQVFARSLA